MKKIFAVLIALAAAVSFAVPAWAINMDATFDAGALPADFGFNAAGSVLPSGNVAGGVWTNNLADGQSSVWAGGVPGATSVVGPVWHGWSEIQVVDFGSGGFDDRTAFGLFRHNDLVANPYGFLLYFNNGEYRVLATGASQGIAVANTDGQSHKYGWQVDESTREIKLFFDDLEVGVGTMTGNFAGESGSYFGDGTGGAAHHEIWNRVVVAEGAYPAIPEPSSAMLLGAGALGFAGLLWKKRRRT